MHAKKSQAVCIAFRERGHNAFSCDIEPCSGGHPEWHLQQDVIPLLKEKWDIIIAFPPCTYLTVTGNRWFNIDRYGEKAIQRYKDRKDAIDFFMAFANADCEKIAIEKTLLELCRVNGENLTKLSIPGSLVMLLRKRLVFG